MPFDPNYLQQVLSGAILPPSGYRISDDGTELVEKTEEEILTNDITTPEGWGERMNYLSIKISEGKSYLADTDYIVSKLAEVQLSGDDTARLDMKAKYQDQLQRRKVWRENINRYEVLLTDMGEPPVRRECDVVLPETTPEVLPSELTGGDGVDITET